jgi:large subunit ribosomal protein L22
MATEFTRSNGLRYTANRKYIRVSPIKMGYLARELRGKKVNAAMAYLKVSSKRKLASIYEDVLRSAVFNVLQKEQVDLDKLVIRELCVAKGPTFKRFRAKAKGSAGQILKYSSHLSVLLGVE